MGISLAHAELMFPDRLVITSLSEGNIPILPPLFTPRGEQGESSQAKEASAAGYNWQRRLVLVPLLLAAAAWSRLPNRAPVQQGLPRSEICRLEETCFPYFRE